MRLVVLAQGVQGWANTADLKPVTGGHKVCCIGQRSSTFGQYSRPRTIGDYLINDIKPQLHSHNSSRFEPEDKIWVHGNEKRKSSINTVSHDAPTVSAQFIYQSTTIHHCSATIHHCRATNAHDVSTIPYPASMVQASGATPPPRTVLVMDLGQIKVSVIHQFILSEHPRMTTNPSTVPLGMSANPLR